MNDPDLENSIIELLAGIDAAAFRAQSQGMDPHKIAGAFLARTQHWYLKDDPSDLEGLERLMEYALKSIRDRPRFDIE